jgi:hypothetical protein
MAGPTCSGSTTSPHELLAELWAEFTLHPSPRRPAVAFGEYVMRYMKDRLLQGSGGVLAPHKGVWPAREVF